MLCSVFRTERTDAGKWEREKKSGKEGEESEELNLTACEDHPHRLLGTADGARLQMCGGGYRGVLHVRCVWSQRIDERGGGRKRKGEGEERCG